LISFSKLNVVGDGERALEEAEFALPGGVGQLDWGDFKGRLAWGFDDGGDALSSGFFDQFDEFSFASSMVMVFIGPPRCGLWVECVPVEGDGRGFWERILKR
jgi:hypothetical protein